MGTEQERHKEAYDILRPLASDHPDDEEVQYSFAQAALKTQHIDESILAGEAAETSHS